MQKATPDRYRGKVFGFKSSVTTLAFLATTWMVSQSLTTTSPFEMFKVVSYISLAVATIILVFDRSFTYFVLRKAVIAIFRTFYPVNIEGIEYLNTDKPVIIAGNYTGWFDTLILTAAIKKPIWYVTGPAAFRIPIVKWIVPYMNVIPLKFGRGIKALEAAVKYIQKGCTVCIFPEGKLTENNKLNKFQRGVGVIHKNSKAPIVPFAIRGGFEAWSFNKPPKFSRITIQFGQPISMLEAEDREVAKELEERVDFMKEALERREKARKNDVYADTFLSIMQNKSDIYGADKALALKDKNGWSELSYIELSRQAKNFSDYLRL